ncbi:MAG TPA: ABC transporter ATP-binding protein [Agriterribacter sp.]|nr:ABC transporter ATP-binding protein [Agriterribacter sp.]
MALLQVSAVSKEEGNATILQDISFSQQSLQKIAIAGASGSGKSTLLKIIAGLIQPDHGEVWFENTRVKGPNEKLTPGQPEIAYLSQHFELRNNYRVEEILDYANTFTIKKADALYRLCRIDHLLKRRTDQLSGGEKQRIALARLLSSAPKLLLLDEPFSNLDLVHSNLLREVIQDISERLGITCILVSHNPADLLSWADDVFIVQSGRIIQRGSPQQVYYHPENTYVAELLGAYNVIWDEQIKSRLGFSADEHKQQDLILRPESFELNGNTVSGLNGTLNRIYFRGGYYEVEILLPTQKLLVRSEKKPAGVIGDDVFVSIKNGE